MLWSIFVGLQGYRCLTISGSNPLRLYVAAKTLQMQAGLSGRVLLSVQSDQELLQWLLTLKYLNYQQCSLFRCSINSTALTRSETVWWWVPAPCPIPETTAPMTFSSIMTLHGSDSSTQVPCSEDVSDPSSVLFSIKLTFNSVSEPHLQKCPSLSQNLSFV